MKDTRYCLRKLADSAACSRISPSYNAGRVHCFSLSFEPAYLVSYWYLAPSLTLPLGKSSSHSCETMSYESWHSLHSYNITVPHDMATVTINAEDCTAVLQREVAASHGF